MTKKIEDSFYDAAKVAAKRVYKTTETVLEKGGVIASVVDDVSSLIGSLQEIGRFLDDREKVTHIKKLIVDMHDKIIRICNVLYKDIVDSPLRIALQAYVTILARISRIHW